MNLMKLLTLSICMFFCASIFGQIQDSKEAVFEVEFEKFSPSNQDQIREFVGKAPMPFHAPDIEGNEQDIRQLMGKTVFIYFFNTTCNVCEDQISALNLINEEYGEDLHIIAIGDESKNELLLYKEQQGINYPILYQGKLLGEAAFGIEMGYPRLFVVDKKGITQQVLPEEALLDTEKTYLMLDNLYKLVNAN